MADTEIVQYPPCVIQSFTARYGRIDEHLDEDTWLSWFGIWASAWKEAERHITPRLEELRDTNEDLRDALAAWEALEAHGAGNTEIWKGELT
jgi:hypothetical protein